MAIKYDIYASPVPSGSQREPNYHARVVGSRTVDMQEVIDHIHGRCTLTKGDLKAAFAELSEEENVEQFQMLIAKLKEAGYRHYEISNFALPGRESRHNSSYWNDTPYIGCGAAAHSYNGTSRQWNIADIQEYIKGIESNNPNFEIEELTEEERYNDTILTRLRTAKGLPLAWIKERFSEKLNNYMLHAAEKEIALGNLKEEDGHLSLTEKGIFISDAVIRELIFI